MKCQGRRTRTTIAYKTHWLCARCYQRHRYYQRRGLETPPRPAKRPPPPRRERAPYTGPIFRDPNPAESAEMAVLRDQLLALWAAPVHDHGGETRILAGMRRLLELRTKA
jgi:hypothetical protein